MPEPGSARARERKIFMRLAITPVLAGVLAVASPLATASGKKIEFTDVKEQTVQFIRYYEDIELTREQEAVKREALSSLPAACCSSNSAYTCCCVCNLSRTVWGLTAYLITEHEASVEEIRDAVREWTKFVNPAGFSGDSCFKGGCARSFEKNGCGGMQPSRIIWD
jgi:hypothetical protein